MELTLLIQSGMGLLVLLGLLVFFLVISPNAKKEQKAKKGVQERKARPNFDMEHLRSIVKDRGSTAEELKGALDLVLKYHGKITKKLGLRPHPDSHIYMDILFNVCRHPNANKNIIVDFDKELGKSNPDYKKELNDAMMRGLNSRGF